jgi:hypothetical protein
MARWHVTSSAPYAKAWPLHLNAETEGDACAEFRRHYGDRCGEVVQAIELNDANYRELVATSRQTAIEQGYPL